MCFILLQEPYNNVDTTFFELFRSFPKAEIPKEPEHYLEFKAKLDALFADANLAGVDVIIKDAHGQHFTIVKNLEEFEREYQILETLEHSGTPDLPKEGNFWAFSNQPFTLSVKPVYDNEFDEFNYSEKQNFELPNSRLDQAHKLSGSELRIVDRLSKYGESFPFLNEDGSFSDAALADIDELLMTEATDADLLNFIRDGIDAVDRVAGKAKDAVSGTWNAGKDLAKGAKDAIVKGAKGTAKAAKWVDKKLEITDKAKDAGAKERLKELINKELEKIDDINVPRAAKDEISGKEDSKAIKYLKTTLSNADGVAKKLTDNGNSGAAKKIDQATDETRKEYKEVKKELKDGSKDKESR